MTPQDRRIWVVFVVVALIVLLAFAGIGEGPNRPLEGKAERATVTGLDIISAASPILSALIAIGGVLATLWFTNRREEQTQEHERKMQLNNERQQAYATLAKLTKGMDLQNPEAVPQVNEAYAMVEILGEDPKLLRAADDLVKTWTGAWLAAHNAYAEDAPNPWDAPGYRNVENLVRNLRRAFIGHAREEIGVKEGEDLESSR